VPSQGSTKSVSPKSTAVLGNTLINTEPVSLTGYVPGPVVTVTVTSTSSVTSTPPARPTYSYPGAAAGKRMHRRKAVLEGHLH
jgi:hypothetical protein